MTRKRLLVSSVLLLLACSVLLAQVRVSPDVQKQIQEILAKPYPSYPLDTARAKALYQRIDTFFGQQIDFNKATVRTSKSGRVSYRQERNSNLPLSNSGGGVRPTGPYNIWYIKNEQLRSFRKDFEVPSDTALSDSEAIAVGKAFLSRVGHLPPSTADKLGEPTIISRMTQDPASSSSSVLYQIVRFPRAFKGLPVFNSHLAVYVHSGSKEITGFKHIRWEPVMEDKGSELPARSLPEVLQEIKSRLSKTSQLEVISPKLGMYQTDRELIPVILLATRLAIPAGAKEDEAPTVTGEEAPEGEQIQLIVSLVKDPRFQGTRPKRPKPTP